MSCSRTQHGNPSGARTCLVNLRCLVMFETPGISSLQMPRNVVSVEPSSLIHYGTFHDLFVLT